MKHVDLSGFNHWKWDIYWGIYELWGYCTRNGWHSIPTSWFIILLPTWVPHQTSTSVVLGIIHGKTCHTNCRPYAASSENRVITPKFDGQKMLKTSFFSKKRCHFWQFPYFLDTPTSQQHPELPLPRPKAPRCRCCGDTSDPPPLPPVAENDESIASAPGCVHPQRTPGCVHGPDMSEACLKLFSGP